MATIGKLIARAVRTWQTTLQDVRYGVRSLLSQPLFTTMALLALVAGIGVNTSLFTVFNAVAFRPWDVPEAERMVQLHVARPRFGYTGFAIAMARQLDAASSTLSGAFAWTPRPVVLDAETDAPAANAVFVSGNYFKVLGIGMSLGRPFSAEEDVPSSPVPVAVLSHALWTQRYGADSTILGRTIKLDGVDFTVIGVAPRDFAGTYAGRSDLWAPLSALALARPGDPLTNPARCCVSVAARLAPGVTREQARAELDALFRRYAPPELVQQLAPDGHAEAFGVVLTGTALISRPDERQEVALIFGLLLAAVVSILLLACANVSNLQLARAAARQREIAVRLAIGASRGRVVRQLFTESMLLGLTVSVIAVALSYVLPDLVFRLIGERPPSALRFDPDLTVLAYSLGLGVLAAVAFGIAPALRGTDIALADAMKQQASHATPRFPLRSVLLGVQVAVSVMLLVGAGLLVRGLERAQDVDPGFRTDGVTALQVRLPVNEYDAARQRGLLADVLRQLEAQGVRAGASDLLPLAGFNLVAPFRPTGQAADPPSVLAHSVNAAFFDVLGIPVISGRALQRGDQPGSVVVVNESLARRYWPDGNAVGQTATIGAGASIVAGTAEVVGVVRDAQLDALGSPQPAFFSLSADGAGAVLVVPADLVPQVVATVRANEPRAVIDERPMAAQLQNALGDSRGAARVASVLGALALLLATIGVYGVVAYSVEQNRREIAVRMALGARPTQVVGTLLGRNSRALLGGVGVGLLLAVVASVLLQSQFYGVQALDPAAYAAVLALILLAGVAASAVPGVRATRLNTVDVLRNE
jgi:putative ABC transport system permease protein